MNRSLNFPKEKRKVMAMPVSNNSSFRCTKHFGVPNQVRRNSDHLKVFLTPVYRPVASNTITNSQILQKHVPHVSFFYQFSLNLRKYPIKFPSKSIRHKVNSFLQTDIILKFISISNHLCCNVLFNIVDLFFSSFKP